MALGCAKAIFAATLPAYSFVMQTLVIMQIVAGCHKFKMTFLTRVTFCGFENI